MTTTNLRIRELSTADVRDERVVSDAINKVDQRLSNELDLVVPSDASMTLTSQDTTEAQTCNFMIRVRDPSVILTATRQVVFPAGRSGPYALQNMTAQTLQAVVSGGASVSVLAGNIAELVSDGTDMLEVGTSIPGGGGAAGTNVYDVPFFFQGKPAANAEVMRIVWVRDLEIPAGATSSQGSSETLSATESTYSLRKNGVQFGTATFAAAASTCTFIAATKTSFASGDTLSMISPSVVDATQENIGFMIHMRKK